MHHPGGEPSAMPRTGGSVVPRFVNRFNCDGICVSHGLNRMVNELGADSLTAKLLRDIHCIDNANPPRFDNGGDGFPVVDTRSEESYDYSVHVCHETEARGLAKSGGQPAEHGTVRVGSDPHIRTRYGPAIVKPGLMNLRQIVTGPLSYIHVYFHCQFPDKLR